MSDLEMTLSKRFLVPINDLLAGISKKYQNGLPVALKSPRSRSFEHIKKEHEKRWNWSFSSTGTVQGM